MRIIGVLVLLTATTPAFAQTPTEQPKLSVIEVRWRDQPRITAGPLRVDVHAKVQADMRRADQDLENVGGTYETALKRIGIEGRLTDRLTFEVERELRKQNPWRNVYVNVEVANAL
jgi:hypothetical protein